MKKAIFLALTCASTLTACKKECGEYQTLINGNCTDWNQRYVGIWESDPDQPPSCTNGEGLVTQAGFNAGSAPNKVSIGDGYEITLTEPNAGEGGPWTLSDNNGSYQLNVKIRFYPGTSTSSVYPGMPNTGTPRKITYSLYKNKGTQNEVYCYGEYY